MIMDVTVYGSGIAAGFCIRSTKVSAGTAVGMTIRRSSWWTSHFEAMD